jgi:hypothetical protein
MQFDLLWERCGGAFSSRGGWKRARRLALSALACLGRHTITGLLCAGNRQGRDWSADFRLFSRKRFFPAEMFGAVRRAVTAMAGPGEPLIVSMDDSILRKTGRKVYGVGWRRDPMSPPFRVNFVRGIRVLQISAAVTGKEAPGEARMVPVDFIQAPSPKKPRKDASPEEMAAFKKAQEDMRLGLQGIRRITALRENMDKDEPSSRRPLWTLVDGSYTNRHVLRKIPDNTLVIGRVRGDAQLSYPPTEESSRAKGRKRRYGDLAPTPEELRKDGSAPWQTVQAWACGKKHDFKVKTLDKVMWRTAGPDVVMRLVVISPLAYRPSKGAKLQYRNPAYLLCTDPSVPVEQAVQAYVWRWDVEVNFRDEKQMMGIEESQVRTKDAVENVPAFMAAVYAMLLVSSSKAFGLSGTPSSIPPPKWRKKGKPRRASTASLINQLRFELWGKALGAAEEHSSGFVDEPSRETKPEKCLPNLATSVFYAMN